MATGIKITNASGTTQIDESYFNLVLIDKQSVSISAGSGANYDYSVNAGDVCVIAISMPTHNFTIIAASASGGTWTYRINILGGGGPTAAFTIYAFGKCPTPTETVGLKVQGPSGQTIFHSQFKPMRVVGVSPGDTGFTGPSGRDLAVILTAAQVRVVGVFPTAVYETWFVQVGGNTVSVVSAGVASAPAPLVGFSRAGSYAVVDVTNY